MDDRFLPWGAAVFGCACLSGWNSLGALQKYASGLLESAHPFAPCSTGL